MQPIFVKVRNDQGQLYDSYTDYWRLVELGGFSTCELDEIKPNSTHTYIFSPDNGNVREHCIGSHNARYILWQLERPGKVDYQVPDYFDEMWVSDKYFHVIVNSPKCRYVTLGGHPDLGIEPKEPKKWDFVHLSYLYGERERKVNTLKEMGFTMAPNGWGKEREESIAYSRYGLALHQDDKQVIEPLRYVLFACSKLPIVAEPSVDYYPYEVVKVESFNNGLTHPAEVDHNYTKVTQELTFRKCVEGALSN